MRPLSVLIPLLAWLLPAVVLAQTQTPACAQKCLVAGIADSYCATVSQDQLSNCVCNNLQLGQEVSLCVASNCTVKEALLAQGISNRACGLVPRDSSNEYFIITVVFAVLAGALVLARLAFKVFMLGWNEVGHDDLFIFLAVLCTVPSAIITCRGTLANGLGVDIWAVPVDNIYNFMAFFYAMSMLYFLQVGLLKMSLLFFYLRIFPSQGVRRVLWGTVAFNAVITLIYILLDIFQCQPIDYFWNQWDRAHIGSCPVDLTLLTISNGAISIALDIWMLAVPLWQLRGLQLHWNKKLGVAMMFAVGTLFTILSCIRLKILVGLPKIKTNITWDQLEISIWSTIEITVGIICACMPTMRLLLVRLFPSLSGSTNRSYATPSGYPHGGIGSAYSKGSRRRPSANKLADLPLNDLKSGGGGKREVTSVPPGAIRMQREYTVTTSQFVGGRGDDLDDGDEARLVTRQKTPPTGLTEHQISITTDPRTYPSSNHLPRAR